MHPLSYIFRFRVALAAWIGVSLAASTAWAVAPQRPSLVVAISIDQFRADYLARFREHFGPDGFALFLDLGAEFADCHYRHSMTKTGCGHATMLTGVHANLHGIIANDWLVRGSFERVSCVGDDTTQILGLPSSAVRSPGIDNPFMGRSPKNLTATNVGDILKLTRGNQSKVIGISNKDRSAILMAGKLADAAFFMESGHMVSSTYYFKELPAWVQAWNAAGKVEAYFGKVWDRVLPVAAYAGQGPDDAPGEDVKTAGLGNLLPKTINGGEARIGPRFYEAFENSPFSNEVLLDFTKAAVEREQLGQRAGITDILCVSFSGNDFIGHLYGPDSHEIMDNVVRMDRTLAEFFKFLDERVGLKNCTLVLTADHGVSPMPERINAVRPGVLASRSLAKEVEQTCQAALDQAFGPLAGGGGWFVRDDASIFFYEQALAEKKIASAAAQAVVKAALLKREIIQAAYTRVELENQAVSDQLGHAAVLSFNRALSGDVYFQTKPYVFNKSTGSTHGAPYSYDTHVPLLWYGVGVTPGVRPERVGVDDLAPTLARILGLSAPPGAEGRILF